MHCPDPRCASHAFTLCCAMMLPAALCCAHCCCAVSCLHAPLLRFNAPLLRFDASLLRPAALRCSLLRFDALPCCALTLPAAPRCSLLRFDVFPAALQPSLLRFTAPCCAASCCTVSTVVLFMTAVVLCMTSAFIWSQHLL